MTAYSPEDLTLPKDPEPYPPELGHALRLIESAAAKLEEEAGADGAYFARRLRGIARGLQQHGVQIARWRVNRDSQRGTGARFSRLAKRFAKPSGPPESRR